MLGNKYFFIFVVFFFVSFFSFNTGVLANEKAVCFKEEKLEFSAEYSKYLKLKYLGDDNEALVVKRLEILRLIKQTFVKKQAVLSNKKEQLYLKYQNQKQLETDISKLDFIHNQILSYEEALNEIYLNINKCNQCINTIIAFSDKEAALEPEIDKQLSFDEKQEVFEKLRALLIKRKELILSGASPSEVFGYQNQISHLKDNFFAINTKLGISFDDATSEYNSLLDDVNKLQDADSVKRNSGMTDLYKDRFDKDFVTKNVEIKKTGTSVNEISRWNLKRSRMVDRRLEAKKKVFHNAGK